MSALSSTSFTDNNVTFVSPDKDAVHFTFNLK